MVWWQLMICHFFSQSRPLSPLSPLSSSWNVFKITEMRTALFWLISSIILIKSLLFLKVHIIKPNTMKLISVLSRKHFGLPWCLPCLYLQCPWARDLAVFSITMEASTSWTRSSSASEYQCSEVQYDLFTSQHQEQSFVYVFILIRNRFWHWFKLTIQSTFTLKWSHWSILVLHIAAPPHYLFAAGRSAVPAEPCWLCWAGLAPAVGLLRPGWGRPQGRLEAGAEPAGDWSWPWGEGKAGTSLLWWLQLVCVISPVFSSSSSSPALTWPVSGTV